MFEINNCHLEYFVAFFVRKQKFQRVWLINLMPFRYGIKYANQVKLSQILAIRTTFCTHYSWNKSKYCVCILFASSLLLHFIARPVELAHFPVTALGEGEAGPRAPERVSL